jgi:hypothetical protein
MKYVFGIAEIKRSDMNNQSPKCPKCGGMLQYAFDPKIEYCHTCGQYFRSTFQPIKILPNSLQSPETSDVWAGFKKQIWSE